MSECECGVVNERWLVEEVVKITLKYQPPTELGAHMHHDRSNFRRFQRRYRERVWSIDRCGAVFWLAPRLENRTFGRAYIYSYNSYLAICGLLGLVMFCLHDRIDYCAASVVVTQSPCVHDTANRIKRALKCTYIRIRTKLWRVCSHDRIDQSGGACELTLLVLLLVCDTLITSELGDRNNDIQMV